MNDNPMAINAQSIISTSIRLSKLFFPILARNSSAYLGIFTL